MDYYLSCPERVLCAFTLSALPYTRRHWEISEQAPELQKWGHRIVAVLEACPILGLIVAVIERIFSWALEEAQQWGNERGINSTDLPCDARWMISSTRRGVWNTLWQAVFQTITPRNLRTNCELDTSEMRALLNPNQPNYFIDMIEITQENIEVMWCRASHDDYSRGTPGDKPLIKNSSAGEVHLERSGVTPTILKPGATYQGYRPRKITKMNFSA